MKHELKAVREATTDDWRFTVSVGNLDIAELLARIIRDEKCSWCALSEMCTKAQPVEIPGAGVFVKGLIGADEKISESQVEYRNC